MAKRPDFIPIPTHAGWMISIPASMSATGKRTRKFYKTPTAAEKAAASLRAAYERGVRGGLISAEIALQAAAAVKVLEPLGISLVEAAHLVVAMDRKNSNREQFQKKWERVVTIGETMWSSRYATDMGKIPRWIGKAGMRMKCSNLSEAKVAELLRENGAASLKTLKIRKAMVMAVLGWNEDRPERDQKKEIEIMTPRMCGRLLRACETKAQVQAVALLLFAGIRPDAESGEISRLDWSAVGEKEIYVDKKTSKVGDRHITITPRLARLLRGHPEEGPVMPANWKRAWQRMRKEAGISQMQDVTRHTFASCYLAAYGEDATKAAMGHTKGSDTLFRHYRRAVTADAGKKYFR